MTPEPEEGVTSIIEFPLGQDVNAVSKAIYQLLTEGWIFHGLTKTHLRLIRVWIAMPPEEIKKEEAQS